MLAGVVAMLAWQAASAPAQTDGDSGAGDVDLAVGGELYSAWCVHCHGNAGQGVPGEGAEAGPAVDDVDVRYVDLLLRTGRMPISEPSAGIIQRPDFTDHQRESLVAWMGEEFGLSGELPVVSPGEAASGADLYATHCAACHGAGGIGGVAGGGATVRKVKGLDPEAVVEAIRVGPFEMPPFSEEQISDDDAEDIAAFVSEMSEGSRTPLGFGELNRVSIGALVIPLLIGVMGAVMSAARAGAKRGS